MAKGKDSLGNPLPEVGAICQTCNRTITSKCDRKRHYLCASDAAHRADRIARRKFNGLPLRPEQRQEHRDAVKLAIGQHDLLT